MNDKTIVYMDGVFDLFHRGHLEAIKKAKAIRPNVWLIIGLCGDYEVTDYKRKPFFSEDDRYQILSSIREVDQVIFPGPLVITREFIDRHKIDLVVHGFSDMSDIDKQSTFFEQIKDKFETIPYYPPVSTSNFIKEICERYAKPIIDAKNTTPLNDRHS
jgi:cytidyltransferase-like protein